MLHFVESTCSFRMQKKQKPALLNEYEIIVVCDFFCLFNFSMRSEKNVRHNLFVASDFSSTSIISFHARKKKKNNYLHLACFMGQHWMWCFLVVLHILAFKTNFFYRSIYLSETKRKGNLLVKYLNCIVYKNCRIFLRCQNESTQFLYNSQVIFVSNRNI